MNVQVNVYATRCARDGVNFHCTWKDSTGVWHTGPIEFPFGSSRNRVRYDLEDETGLNLQFEELPNNAVWFQENSCPLNGPGNDLGEIVDKQVHESWWTRKRKKLTLTNLNRRKCDLHYALRFTGDPWTNSQGARHNPPYVCDPEYRNNGGGG